MTAVKIQEVHCGNCKYPLLGCDSATSECPECGATLGRSRTSVISREHHPKWLVMALFLLVASLIQYGFAYNQSQRVERDWGFFQKAVVDADIASLKTKTQRDQKWLQRISESKHHALFYEILIQRLINDDVGILILALESEVSMDYIFLDGTPLLHHIVAADSRDALSRVLASGVNTGLRDNRGESVMHFAVRTKNYDAVQLLSDFGFAVNTERNIGAGETPLHYAVSEQDLRMIDLLIRCGADEQYTSQSMPVSPREYAIEIHERSPNPQSERIVMRMR